MICTYGDAQIIYGSYGGSILIIFEVDATFYEENEVELKLFLEAAVTGLNCLLGIRNTNTFGASLTCNLDLDFWINVNFTISVVGGRVPDLLSDFSYSSRVESVTNYPTMNHLGLQPLSALIDDTEKAGNMKEAIINYHQGNFTCSGKNLDYSFPEQTAHSRIYDSTCYPRSIAFTPSAAFKCSTASITECAKDWDNCCSAAIRI